MKRRGKLAILALVLILAAAGIIAAKANDRASKRARYQELCEQYPAVLQEYVPKRMESLTYYQSAEVNAELRIGDPDSKGIRIMYDTCLVSVYVDDAFDRLDENSQYDLLCEMYRLAQGAVREALEEHLPESKSLRRAREYPDVYGTCRLRHEEEYEYYIKTSANTYRYAKYVSDYFIKNDEEVFTPKYWKKYHMMHPTPTPTQAPYKRLKPKSGYKYQNSSDPYDVDWYDDPEDFWEENEDDFDDFEDAWDYWEEHQEE